MFAFVPDVYKGTVNHLTWQPLRNEIDSDHFRELFQRYLAGECSAGEIDLLLKTFELTDRDQLTEQVLTAFRSIGDSPATAEEWQLLSAMFERMQTRIAPKPPMPGIYKMVRWPAAAAVLAAVCLGGFSIWRNIRHVASGTAAGSEIAQQPVKIVPGHSGATLRLSGGQTILLDSMATGPHVMPGNVRFTKRKDEIVYQGGDDAIAYNSITTARGQEWHLTLPDGTRVWLNAATTISFPTSFDKLPTRTIDLQGEAYFEVAANKDKPFLVHTAVQDIKDIGTHFNVSCYPDDPSSKTTLLQGAVQINGAAVLHPGQEAATTPKGKTVIKTADTEAAIAWKNGSFDFTDNDIRDIMRKVARWYNVDIVYRGVMPPEKLEGSVSRFDDVSRLIGILQKTGLVQITVTGKTIYIDGK